MHELMKECIVYRMTSDAAVELSLTQRIFELRFSWAGLETYVFTSTWFYKMRLNVRAVWIFCTWHRRFNVPSEVHLSLISNLPTCFECAADEAEVGMWSCQSKGHGEGEIILRLRFLFFQTGWGLNYYRSFQNIEADSLKMDSLAPNNCLRYRSVFENGLNVKCQMKPFFFVKSL